MFRGNQVITTYPDEGDHDDGTMRCEPHHASLKAFLKADAAGCFICQKFRVYIGEDRLKALRRLTPAGVFSGFTFCPRNNGGYEIGIDLEGEYQHLFGDSEFELLALPQKSTHSSRNFLHSQPADVI
jgi:hypothetical protein